MFHLVLVYILHPLGCLFGGKKQLRSSNSPSKKTSKNGNQACLRLVNLPCKWYFTRLSLDPSAGGLPPRSHTSNPDGWSATIAWCLFCKNWVDKTSQVLLGKAQQPGRHRHLIHGETWRCWRDPVVRRFVLKIC